MLTGSKFFLRGGFTSVFSFALRDGVIADGNFILEETKESRPPSDADPSETEILQLLKVTVKVILIFGSFHKMFHKSYYSNLELVCININCEFCSYLNPSASL